MKLNIFLVIGLLIFSFNAYSEEVSKIIVKVNNQVITSRDLDEYSKILSYQFFDGNGKDIVNDEEFKGKALGRLIEDTLILDKAKQEGIEIPSFRIENKIEQLISSYSTREDFEESLIEKGLTVALLRKKIEDQYLVRDIVDKYVRSRISVSPKDISSYYSKHLDEFYSDLNYVFYIAKSSERSVLEEISNIIKKEGITQAQAQNDEMLIEVESNRKELKTEISQIIESLKVKESKIKKVGDMFYLIFLEEKIYPKQLSLEEAKEAIHAYLGDLEFRKKFNQWVYQLKDDAVIKNYYEKNENCN